MVTPMMDEADVFVEERMKGDLERNALVSVLLRCLEYYDGMPVTSSSQFVADQLFLGIIILTTNRVRALDSAVQSRINLSIQYQDLTVDQRLRIFVNRLKGIPDKDLDDDMKVDADKLVQKLKRTQLGGKTNKANGRQIRNIVAGAHALALHEGELLDINHLVKVEEATATFIDKMADMMQKQRAKNELE